MSDVTPITPRQRELLDMTTIASQMPVEFENGSRWDEFKGECKICGRVLPDDFVTGIVSRHGRSVAIVEAIGACPDCVVATPYDYRLHDDMRLTGLREEGWCTWMPKQTFWQRILNLLLFKN